MNSVSNQWYLNKMVAQNMLHTYEAKYVFIEQKIEFDTSVDVTKCPQQIEILDLLHICAPFSKLSSKCHGIDF